MPWTLAHSAAGDNDINELGRILAAHTDLNVSDNAGLVPLHVAAGEGAAQAVLVSRTFCCRLLFVT